MITFQSALLLVLVLLAREDIVQEPAHQQLLAQVDLLYLQELLPLEQVVKQLAFQMQQAHTWLALQSHRAPPDHSVLMVLIHPLFRHQLATTQVQPVRHTSTH